MSVKLAERAVACPGWRCMDGMLDIVTKARVQEIDANGTAWTAGHPCEVYAISRFLPDLDDPATLGCFELALLPEALGFEVHARPTHSMVESEPYQDEHGNVTMEFSYPVRWFVYRCEPGLVMYPIGDGGTTRAEALVAALEAAQVVGDRRPS